MKRAQCVEFLQWIMPRLGLNWPGFRRVHGQVCKRLGRRVTDLGLPDFASYRSYLLDHDTEWQFIDAANRSADLAALHAEATAGGSRVVAIRVLPSTLSAVVVRRTGWLPPRERGALEVRYWRRAGPADWFPSRVGIHLDHPTQLCLPGRGDGWRPTRNRPIRDGRQAPVLIAVQHALDGAVAALDDRRDLGRGAAIGRHHGNAHRGAMIGGTVGFFLDMGRAFH